MQAAARLAADCVCRETLVCSSRRRRSSFTWSSNDCIFCAIFLADSSGATRVACADATPGKLKMPSPTAAVMNLKGAITSSPMLQEVLIRSIAMGITLRTRKSNRLQETTAA